jgi:heavy metal response regulator
MNILYVEDDPTAREYIRKGLLEHGHRVDTVSDGQQGLAMALAHEYDVIVLDIGLPDLDGFDVLSRLRERGCKTAVMCLTARREVADRIRGLKLGADDYLGKPFAFAELLARIEAIGRRTAPAVQDNVLRVADLELDVARHVVRRGSRAIDLTRKEFALLEYLMRSAGQVLSRAMITEKIWGFQFDAYSNVIDVHIAHLRRKLDRAADRKLLHTVKGVGYILEDRPTE